MNVCILLSHAPNFWWGDWPLTYEWWTHAECFRTTDAFLALVNQAKGGTE